MSHIFEKPMKSPAYQSRAFDSADPFKDQVVDTLPVLTDNTKLPVKVIDKISTSTIIHIPQRYRWTAFAFILVYSTGAAFTEATLGPLKSTLLKELKINSELYSVLRASVDPGALR
jgi:hypothetical protein